MSHACFASMGGFVIIIRAQGQEEVVAGEGEESDGIGERQAEFQALFSA